MELFVLIGWDGPRGRELRRRVREGHLANLRPLADDGRIRFAGPLLDDDGEPVGSVIVFGAEDRAAAEALLRADPYVTEGVFERWELHRTRQVF